MFNIDNIYNKLNEEKSTKILKPYRDQQFELLDIESSKKTDLKTDLELIEKILLGSPYHPAATPLAKELIKLQQEFDEIIDIKLFGSAVTKIY